MFVIFKCKVLTENIKFKCNLKIQFLRGRNPQSLHGSIHAETVDTLKRRRCLEEFQPDSTDWIFCTIFGSHSVCWV